MKKIYAILSIAGFVLITACKKQFLDAKPNDSLVVPSGLSDLQKILDNEQYMNGGKNNFGPDPSFDNAGSDDYFLTNTTYNSLSDFGKAVYTWSKTIPWPTGNANWVAPYRVVFYANTALKGLTDIHPSASEQVLYDNIKGSALFYRSYQFFNIANCFANTYNTTTDASELGIPLRLSPDISEISFRSTLQETYDRILLDLSSSVALLPDKPLLQTRPSKPAAYALLARVHLAMGNYNKAVLYCDSALKINSTLLDYNKISSTLSVPFNFLNEEVLFQCSVALAGLSSGTVVKIDTTLISKFQVNDLRKNLFFKIGTDKLYSLKGSYSGSTLPFSGIANDEVYLIQAECYARINNVSAAMASLNTLLKNRYASASFKLFSATDAADALNKILDERRKELVLRNLRCMDIRRLNKEGRNISISRTVNNTVYSLSSNDLRFTWPIPDDVIGLTNMPQNPR